MIELNLSIVLISTSGALGRFIDVPAPLTICLRALLGGLVLYLFCRWKKTSFKVASKDSWTIIGGGVLFGLHWVTYFYALQLSNVAIGMLSLFTFPVITAILEPLILKTKILKSHLLLALLILVGIYFLVPEFNMENDHFKAVGFGVFSAFCYALRNIIMKAKVDKYSGSTLMFYQLLTIVALTLPLFFFLDTSTVVDFIPQIIVLGILTTAIGHTLLVHSFKNFSTVTASIISSLQPIYGVVFGMIFLHEYPQTTTIIGGTIIVSSVLVESIRVYRLNRDNN